MANMKYILDVKEDPKLPKHLWFGKKYKTYPSSETKWTKIVEETNDNERKQKKSFRKSARNIILSQRISRSIEAKIKGATLKKCNLPSKSEAEVADLLKWDLPGQPGNKSGTAEQEEPQTQGAGAGLRERRKSKGCGKNFKENPYFIFLDAVSGEEEELGDSPGVMGGLQSWLGFAGSLGGNEVTNMSSVNINQVRRPWLKHEKSNEEGMSKKAEEHMTKIAGDFCTWLRGLPGEDKTINKLTEAHLRSLFDTGQDKARSVLTEQPEEETEGNTKAGPSPDSEETGVEREKGESCVERRHYYGTWYVRPADWSSRYSRLINTRGGRILIDQSGVKLGACLPGQVDMMGGQQPVSQLHSTKAFGVYLDAKNYKKPGFFKYILGSAD